VVAMELENVNSPLEAERWVTHYYRRTPSKTGWIHTNYITQGDIQLKYWALSGEVIPNDKITQDIENGSLQKLIRPVLIKQGQTVWIASDKSVWLANARNPTLDKFLLERSDQKNIYDLIETTILAKLGDEVNTLDPSINYFCQEDNWKILVTIVIKLIMKDKIHENGFASIGFIFPKLEATYKEEFRKFLNEYDMATKEGQLCFWRHHKEMEWEIQIDDNADPRLYLQDFDEEFTPPKIID